MSKTFHVINFGCRATQADGAALEQAFLNKNLSRSESWQDSDVVVLNTCTVTHAADAQARQMVRRVHRENPHAKIVVTGCYAQREPEAFARMKGVTCVVGNSHKELLVPLVIQNHLRPPAFPILREPCDTAAIYCSSIFESHELRSIADIGGGGKTRPVLKVQDGCSLRCSYCVIPYVRGDSRSLGEDEVVRQVEHLLDQGFKEIVFTGIHLGAYGRDFQTKSSLARLMRRVLQQDRLERLRLSSIEPLEVTDEMIQLVSESPKMAKHFHVPLQSGSDRILRLMRRPYTAAYYADLVQRLRRSVPDAAIGADVMVGFPTETDADHEQTLKLLADAPATYLHVFPYSRRPGTASANFRPEVSSPVSHQRSLDLRELAARKNLQFRASFLGRRLSVITLAKKLEGQGVEAMSTNYLKVELPGTQLASNEVLDVVATGLTSVGLRASAV